MKEQFDETAIDKKHELMKQPTYKIHKQQVEKMAGR
jgi:hypothetical protein